MNRRFGALLWAAALSGSVLLPLVQEPAFAAGFHQYSTGYDTSDSNYSGVKATRKDLSISSSVCVYQPIWMANGSGQTNELGSEYGPNCVFANDTWYWGYQTGPNTFIPGGSRALTPGQNHIFSIYYYAGYYYFYVDSTLMWDRSDNQYFTYVQAGLESYDSAASVPAFQDSSLQYTSAGGSWKSWSGEDSHNVGTNMCGHWVSASNWQAGEHQSSC